MLTESAERRSMKVSIFFMTFIIVFVEGYYLKYTISQV